MKLGEKEWKKVIDKRIEEWLYFVIKNQKKNEPFGKSSF